MRTANSSKCFEQETLFCDDYVLVDKSFLPPLSEEQAIATSKEYIDAARDHYHTVVHLYFHPIYASGVQGEYRTVHPHGGLARGGAQVREPAAVADAEYGCLVHVQRATARDRN